MFQTMYNRTRSYPVYCLRIGLVWDSEERTGTPRYSWNSEALLIRSFHYLIRPLFLRGLPKGGRICEGLLYLSSLAGPAHFLSPTGRAEEVSLAAPRPYTGRRQTKTNAYKIRIDNLTDRKHILSLVRHTFIEHVGRVLQLIN